MREKIGSIIIPISIVSAIILTVIAFPIIYYAPRDGLVCERAKKIVVKGYNAAYTAEKIGIKIGDVLLAIGATELKDYFHYEKVRESLRRGQTVEYRIKRNGEEKRIQVTLVGKTARELFYFYLFAAVPFILSVYIYFRKPRDEAVKILCLFYSFLGLIFAFFKAPFHSGFFYSVLIFSASFISAFYVHFTFLLPIKKDFLKRHPKTLLFFYIPSILIFIMWITAYLLFHQHYDLTHYAYVITFNRIAQSWIAFSILFGLGNIIHTYFTGVPIIKRQIKWVLWGNTVGYLPYICLFTLPWLIVGKELLSFDWATVPSLLVPISFVFAITRYRLREVDIVINKSVVYSLVTGILIGTYLMLVHSLTALLNKYFTINTLLVDVISVLVIVLIFTPVRNRLQALVDKLLYKKRQDFRKKLNEFSQMVTKFFDLRELLSSTLRVVKDVFPIGAIAVVLNGKERDLPIVEAEGVSTGTIDRIRRNSELIEPRGRQKYLMHKEGEFVLSIPLKAKNQVVGTINLGPKTSGDIYTSEDMEFLASLGTSLVLGVHNISMMEEVRILSAAIRQSTDGIAITDLKGNIEFLNDAWLRMHGYADEGLTGKNLRIFHSDEQTEKVNKSIELTQSRGDWNGEIIHMRKDKSTFPTWSNSAIMKDETGMPTRLVTVVKDITQMKRAETALRESEEEYRILTETATDAIISIDGKGCVTMWNKAAERIFGYSKKEAIGNFVADLIIPEEYRKSFKNGFEQFRKTGQGPLIRKIVELHGLTKNGSTFPLELSLSALLLKEKWKATAIVRDITDRKKTEQKLKESSENLMCLSKQIIKIQEDERKRISMELHDEIGQALTAVNFRIEGLKNVSTEDLSKIKRELTQIKSIVNDASANVRRISYDLRPCLLDELGLVPTLRWYTEDFSKMANINVKLKTVPVVESLADDTKILIYRIVQEALTNVLKHAEASNVKIDLAKYKNCVKLSIEDDGKGFDEKKILMFRKSKRGMGILGMSERVKLVEGNFRITSSPDHGTKLTVEIPNK